MIVDDQFKLGCLHDWQISGLVTLEDAAEIDTNLTKRIHNVGSVTHQPADFGKLTQPIYRGDGVARRQVDQLGTPGVKKGVDADEDGFWPLAHKSGEGRIDLAAGASVEDLDLQSHRAGGQLHIPQRGFRSRGIGRIDEHGDTSRSWHYLTQEFQPLCGQLTSKI